MIEKKVENWFHEGEGGGPSPKSGLESGGEKMELTEEKGDSVNEHGAKPVHATGESPFHHGSGEGRGHSSDTEA